MTSTAAPADVATTSKTSRDDEPQLLDIAAMFPPDAELIASPEGDKKGLRALQQLARDEEARNR